MDTSRSYLEPSSFSKKIAATIIIVYTVITLIPISCMVMSSFKIVIKEHLPFIIPFLLADAVSGFLFAVGFEITLAVLGLGDLSVQTIGTMIYWGNYYQALLTNRVWMIIAPVFASIVIVVGFYLVSRSASAFLDPRSRMSRIGNES